MKGKWQGAYKYNNIIYQKASGFERTNFSIEIQFFDGENFEGIVNDDPSTGGMDGTGKIIGSLKNDVVYFRKLMPKGRQFIDFEGTRKETDRPHKTLYYTGIMSGNTISGTWKFRYNFAFIFGIIPIPYSPGSGTWEMRFEE